MQKSLVTLKRAVSLACEKSLITGSSGESCWERNCRQHDFSCGRKVSGPQVYGQVLKGRGHWKALHAFLWSFNSAFES